MREKYIKNTYLFIVFLRADRITEAESRDTYLEKWVER